MLEGSAFPECCHREGKTSGSASESWSQSRSAVVSRRIVTLSKALDLGLASLPEPSPPVGLEAALLRRIALQGGTLRPVTESDREIDAIKHESFSLAAALTGLIVSPGVFAYWLLALPGCRAGGGRKDLCHRRHSARRHSRARCRRPGHCGGKRALRGGRPRCLPS